MNFSLLESIAHIEQGILATVLETEGHTYKKTGEKALFAAGNPFPVCGNLGSLCVDQDILANGEKAWQDKRPVVMSVDMSDPLDVHIGYGTYCGGKMTILLEPIVEEHKRVYSEFRQYRERNEPVYLNHNLETGELSLSPSRSTPREHLFVEPFPRLPGLHIVGATPLCREVILRISEMAFDIHVIDWREEYLERIDEVGHVKTHLDSYPFEVDSYVLILSHSFSRDMRALEHALARGCAFIGLLSSKRRREEMYRQLEEKGATRDALERISSPVGIDIGARSDPEVAVSIVAELVRSRRQ